MRGSVTPYQGFSWGLEKSSRTAPRECRFGLQGFGLQGLVGGGGALADSEMEVGDGMGVRTERAYELGEYNDVDRRGTDSSSARPLRRGRRNPVVKQSSGLPVRRT